MIRLILIIGLLASPLCYADLEGYKSPQEAIKAFLSPLKKGKTGINEAMASTGELNGESESNSEIAQTIRADMKDQGKMVRFKEVDNYSRLGGNMQKYTYEIEYSSGKKREVEFTLLRPSAGGGYHIMRMRAN